MIDGVIKTKLKVISLDEGDVMHGMRSDDVGFLGFGEAYFSTVYAGCVKGWKRHRQMTCNFIVPNGQIKIVIFDEKTSAFMETVLSPENYLRLTIPPMVWVAFQGIDRDLSLLLNIASIKHDPTEADTKEINAIKYDWSANR